LQLPHVFNRGVSRKRVPWAPPGLVWSEDADAVLASDVDVIVELVGGLDPAGTWIRRALEAGKSVVTANKKLIAYHGIDLERLAASKGGHIKYGAAVAGGIPVIPGLEQGLAGDRIERMEGILNGTCNFILSKMDEGAEYAAVLAEAQAKGYAEADPTEDVGGFDARAKLAILMRLALRAQFGLQPFVLATQMSGGFHGFVTGEVGMTDLGLEFTNRCLRLGQGPLAALARRMLGVERTFRDGESVDRL